MTIVGTIPKEIYYITSDKHCVDIPFQNFESIVNIKYEYFTTIVTDSLESSEARRYLKNNKIDTQNNVPLSNLKIVEFLHRNSGSVYKALINNYLVEIQDDVLFDTILATGIEPGGNIKAQFIWGKVGTTLKLIRVGSNLYYELQDSNKKKTLPKIKSKQLEIGGIYRTRNGTTQVFLGHVNTTRYIFDSKSVFDYQSVAERKLMLFAEVQKTYRRMQQPKQLINFTINDWDNLNNIWFNNKSNNSFVEKIGNIQIPDNIISKIRTHYKSKAAKILSKVKNGNSSMQHWSEESPMYASRNISYDSTFLNMYPANGSEKVQLFDAKKYLLFT